MFGSWQRELSAHAKSCDDRYAGIQDRFDRHEATVQIRHAENQLIAAETKKAVDDLYKIIWRLGIGVVSTLVMVVLGLADKVLGGVHLTIQ